MQVDLFLCFEHQKHPNPAYTREFWELHIPKFCFWWSPSKRVNISETWGGVKAYLRACYSHMWLHVLNAVTFCELDCGKNILTNNQTHWEFNIYNLKDPHTNHTQVLSNDITCISLIFTWENFTCRKNLVISNAGVHQIWKDTPTQYYTTLSCEKRHKHTHYSVVTIHHLRVF